MHIFWSPMQAIAPIDLNIGTDADEDITIKFLEQLQMLQLAWQTHLHSFILAFN